VNQLCVENVVNCIACHRSGFDIELLNHVFVRCNWVDTDVCDWLTAFMSIPVVVQRYLSLFVPLEGYFGSTSYSSFCGISCACTKVTRVHHPHCLRDCVSIDASPACFAFVCWSSLNPDNIANFFVLSDNSGDVVVTLMDARFYCVNDVRTQTRSRKGWHFFALEHFRDMLSLCVVDTLVHTPPLRLPTSARFALHSMIL
jgi:hypothetical protein